LRYLVHIQRRKVTKSLRCMPGSALILVEHWRHMFCAPCFLFGEQVASSNLFPKPFSLYFPYWPFCVLFWFWLGAFRVPCWCGWIVWGLRSVQRRLLDGWFLFSSFNQKRSNKLVKFLKDRWKTCKVLINQLIAAEKYLAMPKRQKETECTIPSQLYAFI
jgi:hypothetical protein